MVTIGCIVRERLGDGCLPPDLNPTDRDWGGGARLGRGNHSTSHCHLEFGEPCAAQGRAHIAASIFTLFRPNLIEHIYLHDLVGGGGDLVDHLLLVGGQRALGLVGDR